MLCATPALAQPAPGDLDPTFGSGGRVVVPLASQAMLSDLAIQPDGKILAAGNAGLTGVVTRHLPDGTLDPDFGVAGRVDLPDHLVQTIALGPTDEIVVAGIAVVPFLSVFAARLMPDGTPEPGFGTSGIVTTSIYYFVPDDEAAPMESGVCGLAVLDDGRVVAGLSSQIEHPSAFVNALAAIRYGPTGVVDGSFGGHPSFGVSPAAPGGVGVADPTSAFNFCGAMALDDDGGIVLGGQHLGGTSPSTLAFEPILARLASDGTPDLGFGAGGVAHVPGFTGPGVNAFVNDVAPDALGRLVATGSHFDLARYDAAGLPDPSFGTGGVADLSGQYPSAAVAIGAGGHILTAGRRMAGAPAPIDVRFAAMRALDDGSLDPTFAGGDVASTTFAGWPLTAAAAVAEDADGHVVVGGTLTTAANASEGFALARFLGRAPGGTPLTGHRLRLESGDDPERRRLFVVSVDPAIDLGDGPESADDPRVGGATLRVRSDAGAPFDATHVLPAFGWTALRSDGEIVGWRYRADTGAVRRVIVQQGRRLRIVGRGADLEHALSSSPDPVRVALSLGAHVVCMAFGGEVQLHAGRSYRARLAPAPSSCD